MTEDHKVEFDLVGVYPRYTCRTGGCGEDKIERIPFMPEEKWEQRKAEFKQKHPGAYEMTDMGKPVSKIGSKSLRNQKN